MINLPTPHRVSISQATEPIPPTPTTRTVFCLMSLMKLDWYFVIIDDSHLFQGHKPRIRVVVLDDFTHSVLVERWTHQFRNLFVNLFLLLQELFKSLHNLLLFNVNVPKVLILDWQIKQKSHVSIKQFPSYEMQMLRLPIKIIWFNKRVKLRRRKLIPKI